MRAPELTAHIHPASPQCLSSVSISAAEAFAPYAIPIYERSLKLVQKSLAEYIAFRSGQADEPDKTFLIVSLDLLSGLTQGLKENLSSLMAPAGTPPGQLPVSIQLLQSCLDVRPPSLPSSVALATWP